MYLHIVYTCVYVRVRVRVRVYVRVREPGCVLCVVCGAFACRCIYCIIITFSF